MATISRNLVELIRVRTEILARAGGKQIEDILKIASWFTALRQEVSERQWLKDVDSLSYDREEALQYVAVGMAEWVADPTHVSYPMDKLPFCLHKLEWLAKLSTARLKDVLASIDCRKQSRSAVIGAVTRSLRRDGREAEAAVGEPSKMVQATDEGIQRRFDDFVTLFGQHRQLLDNLLAKFTAVEDALFPSNRVLGPPETPEAELP